MGKAMTAQIVETDNTSSDQPDPLSPFPGGGVLDAAAPTRAWRGSLKFKSDATTTWPSFFKLKQQNSEHRPVSFLAHRPPIARRRHRLHTHPPPLYARDRKRSATRCKNSPPPRGADTTATPTSAAAPPRRDDSTLVIGFIFSLAARMP